MKIMIVANPLEQFQIIPIIPLPFGDVDISFTNSSLFGMLGVGFFVLLMKFILNEGNGNIIPSRWQSLVEGIYNFMMETTSNNVGPRGQAYFPFVFALFVFLLCVNLVGMVPYSFTVTSHLIVTLFFSLTVYVGVTIILIREHGYHAMALFLPGGTPLALMPLLVGIELISNVMRVVSLSVRLFANMMAGHILLKVLLGFAWTMMMAGGFIHPAPVAIRSSLYSTFLGDCRCNHPGLCVCHSTCIYLNEALHLH